MMHGPINIRFIIIIYRKRKKKKLVYSDSCNTSSMVEIMVGNKCCSNHTRIR